VKGSAQLLRGARRAAATPESPAWWSQLSVRDLQGALVKPVSRRIVVVFLSAECPVSNSYVPVLNKLAPEFARRGFALVGAYVDPDADLASLREHATSYSIAFPTVDDREHRLVRAASAKITPEAAVFSEDGAVLYRGRIDDRVGDLGFSRPAAVHNDLRDVIEALASGKPGPFPPKRGFGCYIMERVRG
jgi:hypothetical protein